MAMNQINNRWKRNHYSHTEKSYIVSYNRQFPTNYKIITKLELII